MKSYLLFLHCVLLTLCSFIATTALAQTDAADSSDKRATPAENYGRQLRFAVDISKPIVNLLQETRRSYEAQVDYFIRKDIYAAAEAGFGSAKYDYPDLSYTSKNSFLRFGIDKTLIRRLGGSDWDAAFVGLRYGVAFINRGAATYTIVDSVWGNVTGSTPGKAFTAHWAEITGGIRVELLPRLFAGWNINGRFLLNERSFQELSPAFIAGFGRGDRTTVFDFNFYICYALRWGGAPRPAVKAAEPRQ